MNTFSIDHMIPMDRGGTNTQDNRIPAHRRCNNGKENLMPLEFFMGCKLKRDGKRSRWIGVLPFVYPSEETNDRSS